jgi:hypothetical protein
MNKHFSFELASLLMLAAPGTGNAQDIGAAISSSPPAELFRAVRDKFMPDRPVVLDSQPEAESVRPGSLERSPARPDEVLSARSKAVIAKRDAFGAPETPIICTNCAN